jgi:hypothetical protein
VGWSGGTIYTADENVNYYGNQCRGSSKTLKIELPEDPAIRLLGIYPKNELTS